LSQLVTINYATLSRLENNESQLTNDYIGILTKFYNVSADYLLGISSIPNLVPVLKLPIYSFIYGSEPTLRKECFLDYEIAPGDSGVRHSIYLVNHDDSMKTSGIVKGDLMIIEFTNQAENNQVVIIAKDNDPGIVRRVIITEQNTIFIADDEYPIITNTTEWKILAHVRHVTRAIV